jgi:hypothetical protein
MSHGWGLAGQRVNVNCIGQERKKLLIGATAIGVNVQGARAANWFGSLIR